MEAKPFWQSKKFWMTIVGVLAAVVPVVMGMLPPESQAYAVLGAVASVVAYVTAQGKVDAAKALAANPTPPQP